MKKFIIIFVGALLLASCSATKHVENNLYSATGTGISFDRDQAYNIAYAQAVSKISEKYNISVNVDGAQAYTNLQTGGKPRESLETSRNVRSHSQMSGGDFVVSKVKYEKQGRNYVCSLVVTVENYNLAK